MTGNLIWCGTEDDDFVFTGTVNTNQGSGGQQFRSGFCRQALTLAGSITDPPSPRMTGIQFENGAVSTFWFHTAIGWTALGGGSTVNATLARFLDSGGVARLVIRGAGTNGLKVDRRDNSGTFTNLLTTGNNVVPIGGLSNFPVDLFVNYGVSGSVLLYVNSALVGSFTGDTTTNSATALDQVDISCPFTTQGCYISESFISDSNSVNGGVVVFGPVAGGNTQQYTGVVASINEKTILDSAFILDGTVGHLSQWTISGTFPAGGYGVLAVQKCIRFAVGLSGPQHIDFSSRLGGSDFLDGLNIAGATTFANAQHIVMINPNTGVNFLTADLSAAGVAFGPKSLT